MTSRLPKTHPKIAVSEKRQLRDILLTLSLALVVVAVVTFAHWPVLNAGAINLDDEQFLFNNPVLQKPSWAAARTVLCEVLQSSTVKGYYEPLTLLSLMLDVAVGGHHDNLRPFHITSLILHALNVALIIVLVYMLLGRPWVAAGVGLLFGVHPLTVEPVAWVWERKTLLAAFFALWCLILYIRYVRRPRLTLYVGASVMFVLALMSKPTVTPIPVLLLLLDYWPLGRLNKRAFIEKVPLLAIAGVSAIITVISTARNASATLLGEHSPAQLLLKVCYLIIFYLGKIIWPTNLSSIYVLPQPMTLSQPLVLGAVAGTCVLILALVVSLHRTRAAVMGVLFFIIAISPTFGIVQYSWIAASDKYVYIPLIGLLVVLARALERLAGNPAGYRSLWRPATVGLGVVTAASLLMANTRQYLQNWQTTEQYTTYMVNQAPNSSYAYNNRGIACGRKGAYEQAIRDCSKALELTPSYVEAYNNRGNACNAMGAYDQAIQDFNKAIELSPTFADAYNNRSNAYSGKGAYDQAVQDCDTAIALKPSFAEAYCNRGNAYNSMANYGQAIQDCTKAIELKPSFAEAYNYRGNAYHGKSAYDQAIQDYTKAIELRPTYTEAYYNRGNTYLRKGAYGQAIQDCTKTIELKPDLAMAYNNRAVSYYWLKQYDKAWADLNKCRQFGGEVNPGFLNALNQASSRPG